MEDSTSRCSRASSASSPPRQRSGHADRARRQGEHIGRGAAAAGCRSEGGWRDVVAPIANPFADNYPVPIDDAGMIRTTVAAFAAAADKLKAGLKCSSSRAAHGYLLRDPVTAQQPPQKRKAASRSTVAHRLHLPGRPSAVRKMTELPLFIRISATDWAEASYRSSIESIALSKRLKPLGVDLIEFLVAEQHRARGPFHLGPATSPVAEAIRADVLTGAVGLITDLRKRRGSSRPGGRRRDPRARAVADQSPARRTRASARSLRAPRTCLRAAPSASRGPDALMPRST